MFAYSDDLFSASHKKLALAVSLALSGSTLSGAVAAQESTPRALHKLSVEADAESDDIKVDRVASPKFTQPVLDTPQTITVVSDEVLRQQGAGTLVEALANTPGITMQLGENGSTSAGDTFSIRGSSTQTSIFVDGIRDLAAVTRDVFNVHQVEIVKGAASADYGRGATSGYINLVSKLPEVDDLNAASIGIDSAARTRTTGDFNRAFNDSAAMRLNAVWQKGDMVGRDFVTDNRWGIAPALAFGLNSSTRVYLYGQYVGSDNTPDGGIPSIGRAGFYNSTLATAGIQPAAVDSENYYGRYDDFEHIRAAMGTVRVDHEFSENFKLNNMTRYGKSSMARVITGINTLTLSAITSPDTWTVSRSRQSTVQQNKLLTNQTNLTWNLKTGAIEHDLTGGIELIREEQYSPTYGNLGTLPAANVYHPNPYDNYTDVAARAPTGAFSDGVTRTYAAYVFDTLKFGTQWLLTAGVRHERYDTDYQSYALATTTTPATYTSLNKSGNLDSWKVGLIFKPVKSGSIYAAYSNALRPPGGDNFTLSTGTSNNNNNATFDPQRTINIEVGTKWDLLDARLSLTGALYRTEIKNGTQQLDSATNLYVQYGKRRLQGVEFGAVGKITDHWQVTAGLAWSDNEQVDGSVSTNANTQDLAGSTARWAPEYSGNLWTTYNISKWTGGIGANYVSEQKRITNTSVDASTQAGLAGIPGYTVFNGMLSYDVNAYLNLQLNAYNLFNKTYISSLNNGGSRLRLGTPRYGQLTASVKF